MGQQVATSSARLSVVERRLARPLDRRRPDRRLVGAHDRRRTRFVVVVVVFIYLLFIGFVALFFYFDFLFYFCNCFSCESFFFTFNCRYLLLFGICWLLLISSIAHYVVLLLLLLLLLFEPSSGATFAAPASRRALMRHLPHTPAIDTEQFFVICASNVGAPYGSTSPLSAAPDGAPYGPRFPQLTPRDQARAALRLCDALGVGELHAVIGASLGGCTAIEVAAADSGEQAAERRRKQQQR